MKQAFLTVCLLVAGCAAEPLATDADLARLRALEERLADADIASLVTPGANASAVLEILGPPSRSYFNTWEYSLAGFNRPRVLVVHFSSDDLVNDVHVLERRGISQRRPIAAR